ncbi:MAG: alpha-ketoacid dehydrogenase subunit beta, partial [Planctomyces sp.]
VTALIAEAMTFAENSPYPEPASATTHVYFTPGNRTSGDAPSSANSAAASQTSPISAVAAVAENVAAPAAATTNTVPAANAGTPREATWMKATWEALAGEMERNPRIFVLGEGIGKRGGNFKTTDGLYDKYGPVRLCDTPISERGFVGLAGGAAMTGTRPVVDFMFADFVLDSVGEIINQIAKIQYMSSGRIPMPILMRGCIGIGHSAATHHSGSYYSMYGHFPGLRVVVPSNAYDAKGLLIQSLRCQDPVLFLEHRELLGTKCPVPEESFEVPFGQARIVRPGSDVTVVAIAHMVRKSVEAAEKLQSQGISVEVIDPRTISPLDTTTILSSVRRTGRLLIVDETFAPFGVGAEIAARIADEGFDELDAPIRRLNGAFSPTPYSPTLEAAVVPGTDQIAAAIQNLFEE